MKKFLFCALILTALAGVSIGAEQKPTAGFDHVGLSVSDLDASTVFFVDTLGFEVAGRDPKYPAVFMNNGSMSVTLWQTSEPAVAFNRKNNVGLHHLAIKIPSFEALDGLYEVIKELDNVVVEFSPELAYGGPAKHMMIREPSGNRLELVHRPSN